MNDDVFYQDDDANLWSARERERTDARSSAQASTFNPLYGDRASVGAVPSPGQQLIPRGGDSPPRAERESGGLAAKRYNTGKPELSFVPAEQMRSIARALMYGATKYDRDNYRKGFPIASLCDSLLRHVFALLAGEMIDPESGLHHVDMINANAGFLAVGIEADWPMYEETKDE